MGHVTRIPVFHVPNKVMLKLAYSPTETSWNVEIMYTLKEVNIKGCDQTAWIRRLVYTFIYACNKVWFPHIETHMEPHPILIM